MEFARQMEGKRRKEPLSLQILRQTGHALKTPSFCSSDSSASSNCDIAASGGVTTLDDVRLLRISGELYGAIIWKGILRPEPLTWRRP